MMNSQNGAKTEEKLCSLFDALLALEKEKEDIKAEQETILQELVLI